MGRLYVGLIVDIRHYKHGWSNSNTIDSARLKGSRGRVSADCSNA